MLLRRITQHVKDQNWFAVFIDFVIVVFGVFIGIQVANWNTEQQQQQTVKSYLKTIAKNISTDLDAVKLTREKRELAYNLSIRQFLSVSGKTTFSKNEIAFASKAFSQAQELHYVSANTSGYEALKSSGVLDKLQDFDIESLLYNYYDLISQIANDEKNHNDLVKLLWLQYVSNFPDGIDEWEFFSPIFLSEKRFESLQPLYSELLTNNSTLAVYEQARKIVNLFQKYERLQHLGKAFITMVDADTTDHNATSTQILANVFDHSSGLGYPNVMIGGQVALHTYTLSAADSNDFKLNDYMSGDMDKSWQRKVFDYRVFEQTDKSMRIVHSGTSDWAGVWIFGNPSGLDFSRFNTLQIELKGEVGGEKILLNMEDIDDPQDGSSTRYEIVLTDQWQIYTIDLAEFKTADLSKLLSIIGFVFLEDKAQSFSVRTIQFLNMKKSP